MPPPSDRTMRFWNLATRREVARFEMKSVIHSIAFAPNGSALFVSLRESMISSMPQKQPPARMAVSCTGALTRPALLRPDDEYDAEADDEVADEGTRSFKPAAGGAAIQVGRFPRAATNYFPSNGIGRWPLRIGDVAARVVAIPILTPLPDVAGHVVESQGIRQLLPDRWCPEA